MNTVRGLIQDTLNAEAAAGMALMGEASKLPHGQLRDVVEKMAGIAKGHAQSWKDVLDAIAAVAKR